MQVKCESNPTPDILPADQTISTTCSLPGPHISLPSSHDMQCGITVDSKSSPCALWAEYFDSFPILSEFDLRSGVNSSTGSSIASSVSCESWSSPGSGSPFSECDAEDSPFDEHSVPTSVIDEIVQTLKMDGYNFDHLGDEIAEMQGNQVMVKQEQESLNQMCYLQGPVYTSLTPPKLQQMEPSRKYGSYGLANASGGMVPSHQMNNVLMTNMNSYDQLLDSKWCSSDGVAGSLPPLNVPLQQVQQHQQSTNQMTHQLQTTDSQHANISSQQPENHQSMHMLHQQQQQQPPLPHPQQHQQHQHQHQHQQHQHSLSEASYASNSMESCGSMHFSAPVFPGTYSMHSPTEIEPYKYMGTEKSPITSQMGQNSQTCEKIAETKPRRRRSNNNSSRIEKPHVCKECGAAFKLSANLKQHQVIHTGEKPFSCEICKAMFTRLSSLKTHHRLHTGEKPHICPFCSAAFADRSAMKAHKRIHTGERPYKCQVCNTSFTQLSHLNAHKRTHTGEKPYACAVCNTTFKQLGHLKRHEKSHVCSRL